MRKEIGIGIVLLAIAPAFAQTDGRIEPRAGSWKTWVISSGKDYRVPPPPDAAATQGELEWLRGFVSQSSAPQAAAQIRYWDAGPPTYRWIDLISSRFLAGRPLTAYPHRVYTYVALAM